MAKKTKKQTASGAAMTTVGTLPDVSVKGIGRSIARTVLDKTPGLGVLTKWHDSIEAVQREERLQLWLEHVRGEETGEDFKAKIEDGLRGLTPNTSATPSLRAHARQLMRSTMPRSRRSHG